MKRIYARDLGLIEKMVIRRGSFNMIDDQKRCGTILNSAIALKL